MFFALLLAGVGTTSYVTRQQNLKTIHTPVLPPPLLVKTEYETYLDNQSNITVEEIDTLNKLAPLPRLDTHYIDERFITTLHEIDTVEDLEHHMQVSPQPKLANYQELYLTNQNEIVEDERLTSHTAAAAPAKIEIRTIEDTFITNVDEIIEKEQLSTTQRKVYNCESEREDY